jgi:hypothetical protein
MTLGIPKKYEPIVLGLVGLGLAYAFYVNVIAGPSVPTPKTGPKSSAVDLSSDAGTAAPVATPGSTPGASTQPARIPGRAARNDSFAPVYMSKRPEDRPPITKIDPTLHLELLAKLQNVPPAGGRDLFNWGAMPAPVAAALGPEPVVRTRPVGPPGPPPKPPPPGPAPPPPPPPPITLKYYGIATRLDNGRKTAFFMDGEEILLEPEGASFGGRYKLIRIGVNSALIEDTQYKRQQTLPLEEGPPGS